MGCGFDVRILPLPVQRAIKAKNTATNLILCISQYDQNYEWYCTSCERLENSALKVLTLNFDSKAGLTRN